MGKSVEEFVSGLSGTWCAEGLTDIITVEHRSNNKKRDFLFCNKEQGKHIPVSPSKAFGVFDELTYEVAKKLDEEKVLVVGFAETATAIGAYMAEYLENAVYQLQTTREDCKPIDKLIEFSEEHSHATEQYLYGDIECMPNFDYVLFVEDEISTGKTILNFINEFKKLKSGLKFGVASICNWQTNENIKKYEELGIDTFSLLRGHLIDETIKMDVEVEPEVVEYAGDIYEGSLVDISKCSQEYIQMGFCTPFLTERTGRLPDNSEYGSILDETVDVINEFIGESKNILVLGTEEFMYFPMSVAEIVEGYKTKVSYHATTRSSIDVMVNSNEEITNGIVNKSKLHSVYDKNRVTYIYNLAKYDKAIIITDTIISDTFKLDIVTALNNHGTQVEDILFISVLK